MKKFSRLLALALCLALCVCLMAGCGSSSSTTEEAAPAADTAAAPAADDGEYKVFKYGADANCTTFDPYADLQTKSGSALCHAVGETLWTVDTDGNVVFNKLATGYEMSEAEVVATASGEASDEASAETSGELTTELMITVTLREGVTFSNGNAFTSDDVLYTLEHMAATSRTSSMVTGVDFGNTYCPDDYTIVIAMSAYDAAFIPMLGGANNIMLDRETCEADPDFSWLVGTGPYVLEDWEESVQYTLTRNTNYWGDAPYYDEIDVCFYSNESTLYSDFQVGNLDAAYLTEATYVNNVANGAAADAVLIQRAQNSVNGFSMAISDSTKATLSDVNIRLAIAHALDIETMVSSIGEGVYLPADSVLTESSWAYESQGVYEYDPELAAEYLAEAGYSVDNPLTISLVAEGTSFQSAMAEAAQAYLAAIGINLDISGMGDFATILPLLIAGDMDMSIGSPSSESSADPAALLQQLGPNSDNDLLRIEDPDIDALFTQASQSQDQAERTELYHEFQEAVNEQCLFIPVWVGTLNYAVASTHTSFENALDSNNTFDPCLLTD